MHDIEWAGFGDLLRYECAVQRAALRFATAKEILVLEAVVTLAGVVQGLLQHQSLKSAATNGGLYLVLVAAVAYIFGLLIGASKIYKDQREVIEGGKLEPKRAFIHKTLRAASDKMHVLCQHIETHPYLVDQCAMKALEAATKRVVESAFGRSALHDWNWDRVDSYADTVQDAVIQPDFSIKGRPDFIEEFDRSYLRQLRAEGGQIKEATYDKNEDGYQAFGRLRLRVADHMRYSCIERWHERFFTVNGTPSPSRNSESTLEEVKERTEDILREIDEALCD